MIFKVWYNLMGGVCFVLGFFHPGFWFVTSSLWILNLLFLKRLTGNSSGAHFWLKVRTKNASLLRLDFSRHTMCCETSHQSSFYNSECQGLRGTNRCYWPWPASPGVPTHTPGHWPGDLFNLQLFPWAALWFSCPCSMFAGGLVGHAVPWLP